MRRHPLDWLARLGRSRGEAEALLGDLVQQCRVHLDAGRPRLGVGFWYLSQLIAAAAHGVGAVLFRPFGLRLLADTRYAVRRWRRRPGFALAAVVTLALGIASATAVYSVVDHVLLRPLPWLAPESLVVIHGVYPDRRNSASSAATWDRWYVSYQAWDALRASSAFSSVAAWRGLIRLDRTLGEDRSRLISTMDVSSQFLPLLGIHLHLGRSFTEEEDDRTTRNVVLTYEAWERYFDADPAIVGRTIWIGSASSGGQTAYTVVGVTEPDFRFGDERPDILLPVGIPAEVSRQYPAPHLRIVARLAPGVSIASADAVARQVVEAAPNQQKGSARVVALDDELLGSARQPLWLLFGGAGLLLLIACANVAGLLMAEARLRRHEMAVRMAIGASRLRTVRQVLVEHAWLAVFGTVLGIVVAQWLVETLVAMAPGELPRLDAVTLDLRAAAFAGAAGLATLVVFGVIPAVTLARTPVAGVLGEGSRDGAISRGLGARAIVASQIALAVVLLIGASLFAETMFRLRAQPLGFEPNGVAVVTTTFTGSRFGDPAAITKARAAGIRNFSEFMERQATLVSNDLTDRTVARLSALPGVAAVAAASAVPFIAQPVRIGVVTGEEGVDDRADGWRQVVTANYFDVLGIRILEGRTFQPSDAAGEQVAIVSREFQRRFFPDGAVDRRFRQVYGAQYQLAVRFRIIGVVDDVKRQEYNDDVRPLIYTFDRQIGVVDQFIVRANGDPGALLPAARAAIGDVSKQLVVPATSVLDDRVALSIAEERFRASLAAAFGGLALLLASVGLYGLATRRATERRREFAIRVALGATPAAVRRLVLFDAAALIGLGLIAGLPAAWSAATVTESMLYGVEATATHVYVGTAGLLSLVALLATALPARRAAAADPIETIRN